jgi:hypothetical protein
MLSRVVLQIDFPVFLRFLDVFALGGFISSCENQYGFAIVLTEIHPIPRTEEQTQLLQAAVNGFAVAKLTVLHPGNPRQNVRLNLPVQ